MVESKVIAVILVIIIIAPVAGYAVGQFSNPMEQTVTTTSSTTITEIQTITTTSTWNITATVTSTTAVNRDLLIPSPANSTAIIRSQLIYNGTILVTYSIDKPTYSIGEIVHIKSTITNLTPNNKSFRFDISIVDVRNSTYVFWIFPEWWYYAGFGPAPGEEIDLLPGETKILEEWMTADWNMTGLYRDREGVHYKNYFLPEGQYIVRWPLDIYDSQNEGYYLVESISFTITKQN